jgi:hypothetical protein
MRGGPLLGISGALCNAPRRETRNSLWNISSRSFSCCSENSGQPACLPVLVGDAVSQLYLIARIHVDSLPEAMKQSAILEVRLVIQRNGKRGSMKPRG